MSCIVVLTLIVSCFGSCKKENENPLHIYDKNGAEFAIVANEKNIFSYYCAPYIDIVISEAAGIVSELNDCDINEAKDIVLNNGYSIYTYFDDGISTSLKETADAHKDMDMAAAITDTNGNLLAVLSSKLGEGVNLASRKNIPCSSFKPLSVYSVALESGKVNWSTTYQDSPYKKIKDSNGKETEWPANADGKYSYSNVTVSEAIKKSLNTVAVRCIKEIGVKDSVDFLNDEFSIPLSYEKQKLVTVGEDEIIGNIALGYISSGVSVIDMAGFYQMFANGGYYEAPKSISKILDSDGQVLFERKVTESSKVISNSTADLMNKLLQGVVSKTGTGFEAAVKGVEVAGKTGTDEDFKNHWFVGVTPELSFAFWHSSSAKVKNSAPQLFSETFSDIYSENSDLKTKFDLHCNLKTAIYCTETGDLASLDCRSIEKGYYYGNNVPSACKGH